MVAGASDETRIGRAEVPATLQGRFIRSADLVTTEMDGDLVALSLSRGSYFGMSGIGPRLWELLEEPRDLDELVTLVCAEFAVDPVTARADIVSFLVELHENRLLEPVA